MKCKFLLIGQRVYYSDQNNNVSSINRHFCSLIYLKAYVHKSVMEELKRIIDDSEITKEDDALWPPPDRVGRQV